MAGVHAPTEFVSELGGHDHRSLGLLIDREEATQRLRALLDGLRSGRGAATAVVGAPGIGRSALLGWTETLARESGFRVAVARGSREESGLRYGIVQQLLGSAAFDFPLAVLEAPLDQGGESARAADLCRIFVRSARQSPLLVLIDDAQWIDPHSCHWLRTLVGRLRDTSILVVAAVTAGLTPCPARNADAPCVLDELVRRDAIELKPLSAEGIRAVLETSYGGPAGGDLVKATTRHTGGNPAVLHAVLRLLRREQIAPSAASSAQVDEYAAEAVGDQVARVLDGLPDELLALLRAIAVSDRQLPTNLVCRLAGVRTMSSARALRLLRAAGLVLEDEPLALAHQAAARRILAGLSRQDCAQLRAQAAELAYRAGLADDKTARLVLGVQRMNRRWAVGVLRRAAARSRGVDDATAVSYLRRALQEPLDEAERAQLLVELGALEVLNAPEAADARLAEALLAPGSARVMPSRLQAADLLLARGAMVLAQRLTARAWERLETTERESTPLLAVHWLAELEKPLHTRRVVGLPAIPSEPVSPTEPAQAAISAWRLALRGVELDRARELARLALSRSVGEQWLLMPSVLACHVLAKTDDVEEAFSGLDRALLEARRRKLPLIVGRVLGERASLYLWCGKVPAAASDLECMTEEVSAHSWHPEIVRPFAAFEAMLHIERNDLDRAEQVVEAAFRPGGTDGAWPLLVLARGALRLAAGDPGRAVSDLEECGRGLRARNIHNPMPVPWRRLAALARHACGDAVEAERLATEQLALARKWGATSAVGDALFTAARVADDSRAEPLLVAAVDKLEDTPTQWLHGYALARLASVRGATGRSASAVALLRKAIKIAEVHGTPRLLGRITRIAKDLGVESVVCPLTDLEERVIELAGCGLTNRAIAAGLSITQHSVEGMLTNAYRKLGIHGRSALPATGGNEV